MVKNRGQKLITTLFRYFKAKKMLLDTNSLSLNYSYEELGL